VLLDALNWGLVVYDEVHLLPAPVFQLTAQLQARRRLGLTATLIREDGREGDVFSLIGPKRFDVPWKELEAQGYIAPATCVEIRLELPVAERLDYASSTDQERFRLAATTPQKAGVVAELLALHKAEPTLIIGTYRGADSSTWRGVGIADDYGQHTGVGTRAALSGISKRGNHPTGGFQSRELFDRPPRSLCGHSGLRFLWFQTRGGPTFGSNTSTQSGWATRCFLYLGGP
jgi:hypothetical protein